jgi:hypothetical protein
MNFCAHFADSKSSKIKGKISLWVLCNNAGIP